MPPAEGWDPGRLRRAWYWGLGLVAPIRARNARHFARYDEDATYRAQWAPFFSERGYKHARTTGQQTPFTSGFWSRSADSELLHDLHWLRNRSRELARDDPVAGGVLRAWAEGVVGCGIQDRAVGDQAKKDAINTVWKRLRDSLFPAELVSWFAYQRMKARRGLEDGEVLTVRYWPEQGGPVQFELVEADRLMTPLYSMPKDPE